MVRHLILWKLKEDLSDKAKICMDIKTGLEGLKGKIEGLEDIKVVINKMESSNADVMLDSLFADEASLKAYQKHPAHVEVANGYVRPFTEVRMCIDYEV